MIKTKLHSFNGDQIVIRTSNSESHGVVRRIAASLLFLGFSLFLALFTAIDVEMWTMTLVVELWWVVHVTVAWCRNEAVVGMCCSTEG